MIVKAGRIANLTDARYFAAREVDYLGFNLEEGTEGYLDPVFMQAMREWVQGPRITGEMGLSPMPIVREAAEFFQLDAVEIADRPGETIEPIPGVDLIVHLGAPESPVHLHDRLAALSPSVGAFVVELPADHPVWRDPAPWTALFSQYPVLVGADVAPAGFLLFLQSFRPFGINLTGGEEEKTGVKSFEEIDEMLDGVGK